MNLMTQQTQFTQFDQFTTGQARGAIGRKLSNQVQG